MTDKKILMAPHDDGFGAFSTLSRLAHALMEASQENLEITFLCSKKKCNFTSVALDPMSVKKCHGDKHKVRWIIRSNLISIPKNPRKGGVWGNKLLTCVKQLEGREWGSELEGMRLLGLKGQVITEPEQESGSERDKSESWTFHWEDFHLFIGMGVPWLHENALKHGKRSIEVGDMCFSVVLRHCLEQCHLSSPLADHVLDTLRDCELMATEAWLLPYAAPREYEDHFASQGVPVNWLPGVFGPEDSCKAMRISEEISKKIPEKPVGIYAGGTGVWHDVIRCLASLDRRNRGPAIPPIISVGNIMPGDLVCGRPEQSVYSLKPGCCPKVTDLPNMPSWIPLFANCIMGITRGGITMLDHIAARCPIAVAEEPFHWLSLKQREAVKRAGLCLPISLERLRKTPNELISSLLGDRKKEEIKSRMHGIRNDAEVYFAGYLLKRFLRIKPCVGRKQPEKEL